MPTDPTITVTPKIDGTMYMHFVLAEADTDDGWKAILSTTGGLLLLSLEKDGERTVTESMDLNGLYNDWVSIALARRDQLPPPPPPKSGGARPRVVRKKKEGA